MLDTASIEYLAQQSPETVVPLIPALPMLTCYGVQTARALPDVEQHNVVWKYWLAEALFPALPPDARTIMEPSVRRIAEHPTPGERAETVIPPPESGFRGDGESTIA